MSDVRPIVEWFLSDDTGVSSEAILGHMTGCGEAVRASHWGAMAPSDPADLGRCLRLLERFPEWKPRIAEMAVYGPDWAGLCAQWEVLACSMTEEVGIDWSLGRAAPKTYHLMKLAIADGYRKDPDWECTFSANGHVSSTCKVSNEVTDDV
jgi:hypothetical protein